MSSGMAGAVHPLSAAIAAPRTVSVDADGPSTRVSRSSKKPASSLDTARKSISGAPRSGAGSSPARNRSTSATADSSVWLSKYS
jgi:hypothetical protein